MWRIWFFFGILKISFGAPVETSQKDIIPTSELAVLKCLLSSPINSCEDVKRSAEKIPKRIQKLYEKLKRPFFNVTSNEIVDGAPLDTLPASLLYLIPKVRLTSMTGFTASDIVRKFPFDDALTMKILGLFTDKTNIRNFLNGLADREEVLFVSDDEIVKVVEEEAINGIAPISPAVEKEIALALSRWFPDGSQWEYWLYRASMITGTPVLAGLPNYFLNSLSMETTEKFLFHLRNGRWDHSKLYDPSWSQHSMSVKRIWSSIIVSKAEPPNRWTPKILRKFGFFLIGATPDELRELSSDLKISHDFNILMDLNWNPLQARAVFDVGFSGLNELSGNDLNSANNLIMDLLPRQIQQFSYNVTDFSNIKSSSAISIATEKQLFSSHVAHLMSKNNTKDLPPTFWKDHVTSVGKFYHLLPSSTLETFLNESLDLETLVETDSQQLSFRQAHRISNAGEEINLLKPETVIKFKGLLKSVPSLTLADLRSNVISHSVKEHLLMFTSGESLSFTASVLEKIRQDLAQISYLGKMLYNKDFKQYFNLLGNRDIRNFKEFSSNLFNVVSTNPALERNVRQLPSNTLSALLSFHREDIIKRDDGWTYENLVESPLKLYISGLTCLDIEMLETSDFMPVIGYYVHQRRAMHETFPKNMQYCSQTALINYLKLKASLRGYSNEDVGLLGILEFHEVRAVGGYILAGLPIDVISTLGIKYQIISEIGKLTIPELLTATSLENVKVFAEMFVGNSEKYDLKVITGLGNLVWFLREEKIQKLDIHDFKLHLESLEEDTPKALCLSEKERNAWKQLLIRIFGKPDSWSSGTLSYLGDLLFVLDGYELERINKTSWTEAADVLAQSTSFYKILEWPGQPKPIYLYEACLYILKIPERISYKTSVKQLLRFYLESSQFLLDTVSSAENILKLHEEPNLVENAHSMGSSDIQTFTSSNVPTSKDTLIKSSFSEKLQKKVSLEDYEYSSEENDEEETESDFLQAEKTVASVTQVDAPVTKPSREVDFRKATTSPETLEDTTTAGTVAASIGVSHNTKDKNSSQSEDLFKKKRSDENSYNISEDNELSDSEDINIFRSKNTKSLEQLKEELQRNASRALIIEVPLNQTEFMNANNAGKHHMKISCDAIRMLGKPSSLILDVKDFENMSDVELEDCAEVLGRLELDSSVKHYVWRRLKKWKENGILMEVGSLVSVIEENEISRIPLRLSEPWALENLQILSSHITDPEMMSFVADQFLLKNMDRHALTFESGISLGRLVCTMTLSHQRKYLLSHPNVFINIAKSLGHSLDCSTIIFQSCIHQLASIATSEEAFGETSKWNANDVHDLGVIVAGLKKSDWQEKKGKGLKAEAFAGLTPTAVSCIPPDVFKVLTEEQLLRIPTLSASVISAEQMSSLGPSQYEVIDRVRRQILPIDLTASYTSSVPKVLPSISFSISISVTLFITYCTSFRTFFYL